MPEYDAHPARARSLDTPVTAEELDAIFEGVSPWWKSDIALRAVNNLAALTTAIQEQACEQGGDDRDIYCVFHRSTVSVVYMNIRYPGRAEEARLLRGDGQYGLQLMVGSNACRLHAAIDMTACLQHNATGPAHHCGNVGRKQERHRD